MEYGTNYSDYSYWQNKIINRENIWIGNYNNEKVTKDSIVMYTGMFHKDKGIFEHGWVIYPNILTLLGFVQNAFIPTGITTWYKNDTCDLLIPLISVKNLLDMFFGEDKISEKELKKIESIYDKVDELWYVKKNDIFEKLEKILNELNLLWNGELEKKVYIKIFNDIDKVIPFITDTIGWEELVEEEILMNKENIEYITKENVLKDPLLNKTFVEILNNNMPILF